jgi:hypothetical protein
MWPLYQHVRFTADLIWDTVTECMKGCSLPPPYKWMDERMNECMHVCVYVCIYVCIFVSRYTVYVRMYKLRIGAKMWQVEAMPSRYCSVYFLDRSVAVMWLRHEYSVWWHLARKVLTGLRVECMVSRTPCYSMLWFELNGENQKKLEIRTQMN